MHDAKGAVSEAGAVFGPTYFAFISYSHRNSAEARRIHRALEGYRLPPKLRGTETRFGTLPDKLFPVFRDREELSAGGDLSLQVQDALAASRALIILCSPEAAASPWVGKEIETFRALYPERPILAALMAGEPDEAFHPALTEGGVREPVAADFRKGGDGRRLALLKLVAGLTATPLDTLVQRDAQRQFRRVTAITLGALVAVLAMAALLVLALRAQAEAERQRAEAEGMVEYMLTDLRDRLKGVGRLDVMTAVNERAMAYYGKQGALDDLPDESLERRARVVEKIADDKERLGFRDSAQLGYEELFRVTEALLFKSPRSPRRMLAHARSENKLGVFLARKSGIKSVVSMHKNALRLLNESRYSLYDDAEWIRQSALAYGNLCVYKINSESDKVETILTCLASVKLGTRGLAFRDRTSQAIYDLAFHVFWLSEALEANGQLGSATRSRDRALFISSTLVDVEPRNMMWLEQRMELCTHYAKIAQLKGDMHSVSSMYDCALEASRKLTEIDSTNEYWKKYRVSIVEMQKR